LLTGGEAKYAKSAKRGAPLSACRADAEGEVEGSARHVPRRAEKGSGVSQEQIPSEPAGMDPLQESAIPEGADATATAHLGAQRDEDGGRAAAVERGRGRKRIDVGRHR